MYHSINIGDGNTWKNTWDDYFLVSKERPYIVPAVKKTRIVDIPGANGELDLSTYPLGYPLYENRKGTWTFILVNDMFYEGQNNNIPWYNIPKILQHKFSGKTFQIKLEDDPDWYYEGTLDVTGFTPGDKYSEVTISYNLNPFKWYYLSSIDVPNTRFRNISCLMDAYRLVFFDIREEADPEIEWCLNMENFIGDGPVQPIFNVYTTDGKGVDITYHSVRYDTGKAVDIVEHFADGLHKSKKFVIGPNTSFAASLFEFDAIARSSNIYMYIDVRKGSL